MNLSGDAAEQVVRFSLEGMEKVIRVSGEGAKELIVMIFAALRDSKQTMGKTDLVNMLKSGKNIKIFSIKKQDLERFAEETKRYGILYCALLDKKNKSNDGIIDVMVREEDAPKVNRIVERFNLAIVDTAYLRTETLKAKEEQEKVADNNTNENVIEEIVGKSDNAQVEENREVVAVSNEEIIEEILGNKKEKDENSKKEQPRSSKTEQKLQSEHSLKNKGGYEGNEKRVSIRQELEKIKKNAMDKGKKKSKKFQRAKKNIQNERGR